jgi:hypothetical protein
MREQTILNFVSKVDDLGPFCPLSVMEELLDEAPPLVRATPLYQYLRGIFDARRFFDHTERNNLCGVESMGLSKSFRLN